MFIPYNTIKAKSLNIQNFVMYFKLEDNLMFNLKINLGLPFGQIKPSYYNTVTAGLQKRGMKIT
jgi:hypothetical protein